MFKLFSSSHVSHKCGPGWNPGPSLIEVGRGKARVSFGAVLEFLPYCMEHSNRKDFPYSHYSPILKPISLLYFTPANSSPSTYIFAPILGLSIYLVHQFVLQFEG